MDLAITEIITSAVVSAGDAQEQLHTLAASSMSRADGLGELLRSHIKHGGDGSGVLKVVESELERISKEQTAIQRLISGVGR